jgi:hypothetical protein
MSQIADCTRSDGQSSAFRTAHGPARVVDSSANIEESVRGRILARHCKDIRYFSVIERSLKAQFQQRYLILENERTGEVGVQPFFFVDQDLTAGLPGRFRTWVQKMRRRWPHFLVLRMLMVGCAAGEGHLDSAEVWFVEALHESLEFFRKRGDASIVMLKDFPREYREALQPFSRNGYRRVPSMPAATLSLDFANFEEFMVKRLSKVFRKNLRRKFKALADAEPLEMEVVTDVTPYVDEIFPLHLETFHRSEFKFEELTKEYFCSIGRDMPERTRFFLWRQGGRIVAFNLCMVHDGTLYDLDVGMDYSVALDLHLYFVTWRDIISWGLKNGVKTYHTGPLNYDPKLHLRLNLAPQDLYARHASPWLNPLFKIAIEFLQPVRHDPTLKRFANAHEMA